MPSAFLTAIQTLTRIPVPSPKRDPDSVTVGWSAVFYPVVGLVMGAAAIGIYRLLGPVFPRGLVMLLILALWALLTGALHEDGLADTFDAFGSQRARADILRVLKDSQIGVYGVLAVAFAVLLRWQGLALQPEALVEFALVATQVMPRAGIIALAFLAGAATGGTGGALAGGLRFGRVGITVLLAIGIVFLFEGWMSFTVAGACLLVVLPLSVYFRRKIGGVTGDCLGAANQLQEIAILLFLLVISQV